MFHFYYKTNITENSPWRICYCLTTSQRNDTIEYFVSIGYTVLTDLRELSNL